MINLKDVKSNQYPLLEDFKSSPTTAYIRSNIREVEETHMNEIYKMFIYDEIQYSMDEFYLLKINEMNELKHDLTLLKSNSIATLEASQNQQDLILVEHDMYLIMSGAQTLDIKTSKASSSRFELLNRMVENKNYNSMEEMMELLYMYKTANKITEKEYNQLASSL